MHQALTVSREILGNAYEQRISYRNDCSFGASAFTCAEVAAFLGVQTREVPASAPVPVMCWICRVGSPKALSNTKTTSQLGRMSPRRKLPLQNGRALIGGGDFGQLNKDHVRNSRTLRTARYRKNISQSAAVFHY